MDEKFNWMRVVIGGIVGGIAMNIVGFVAAIPSLSPEYEQLRDSKYLTDVPHHPFLEIQVVGFLVLGIVLAFLYAVARHRMGAGPRTAVVVAVIAAFMTTVPSALFQGSWNPVVELTPLWKKWLIAGFAETLIGTFIAAAIYREDQDQQEEEEEQTLSGLT